MKSTRIITAMAAATLAALYGTAGTAAMVSPDTPAASGAKGVGVVLGLPEEGTRLVIHLAVEKGLLVYFQSPSADEELAVRQAAEAAGLLGTRVFADRGPWRQIHLADNLAEVVWLSPAAQAQTPREEVLRVLHPEGKALYGDKEVVKPFPSGIDAWSYPYHGPDNNPQSQDQIARPPYRTQFLAEPLFCPMPEVTVAAGGRVFKAFGLRATHANQNALLNTLLGINGYNGAVLWQRPLRAGFMLDRNTIIATPDVLYLADDESCKLIDARTGRLQGQIVIPPGVGDGKVWKWMALLPSPTMGTWCPAGEGPGVRGAGKKGPTLFALVGGEEVKPQTERSARLNVGGYRFPSGKGWDYKNEKANFGFGRTIVAIDPGTGKIVWQHNEQEYLDSRGCCMHGGRIYYYSPQRFLACLDAARGKPLWKTSDEKLLKALGPSGPAWASANWGYATAPFLKANDRWLFFAGPQRPNLVVASAADGRLLFQRPEGYRQLVLREDALYAIGDHSSSVGTAGKIAYGSWQTLASLPPRHGCTRATASIDSIFYRTGRYPDSDGTWQIRVADLQARHFAPMRPACQDGVIVANGMLYWGPWMCQCPLSLFGHIALAPAGKSVGVPPLGGHVPMVGGLPRKPKGGTPATRLELGEGDAAVVQPLPLAGDDWPCYQGDNGRSATTANVLPERVGRVWTFQPTVLGGRPTAPVTAGGLVFLGDERGVVRALDAATGKPKWAAYTAGAIFFPPAVWNGRVYAGSADGRVYAFEAATGRRLWTFRAAPAERWIPVYGRLHSTWPVAGDVVVEKSVLYAAAGISDFDGTHVYALDAISGKLKWHNDSSAALSTEKEGISLQGELSIRDGALCFCGGTMYQPACYDLATGKCSATLLSKHQMVAFYPYFPEYGQYAELDRTLPDGRKLVYTQSVRHAEETMPLAMLSPVKQDGPKTKKIAARDLLWRSPGRQFNSFILGPNALLAAGSDGGSGGECTPAHFLAAVKLADGKDLWCEKLPAGVVKGGTAVDHWGRIYVALDDGRLMCFAPAH